MVLAEKLRQQFRTSRKRNIQNGLLKTKSQKTIMYYKAKLHHKHLHSDVTCSILPIGDTQAKVTQPSCPANVHATYTKAVHVRIYEQNSGT
jgi:hypothetical protein